MSKLVNFIILVTVLFYALAVVSAQAQNSTSVSPKESLLEETRRRKRYPFGKYIWWWGLKALSVFVTVKIKIILLLLFIGGGIFYGLKIWQGTALGCPEPIIQDIVKHHHHDDILPYHGHFSSSDVSSYPGSDFSSYPGSSFPGSSFDSGPFSGISSPLGSLGSTFGGLGHSIAGGYEGYNGVYSNTPGPVVQDPSSGALQGGSSAYSGPQYLPPNDNFASQPPSGAAGPSSMSQIGAPFTNRRQGFKGRQISEETQTIFSDLLFRFLGVNTDQCRRRFVCELEFRNPFMRYAVRYIGIDLFKEYITPKEEENSPKQFTDCAKLYSECKAPNEQPIGAVSKRRKQLKNKNRSPMAPSVEETTREVDSVTEYVQQRKK